MHPSKKSKRPSKQQSIKSNPSAPPFNLCSSSSPSFSEAIASVANVLKSRKRILVLSGAGISVSCGIPDFRSPQGLYANLDTQELGLVCPEDLFDLECFQDDPRPFYKFAKALYFPLGNDRRVEPSDSHRFLALLEKQGKLLRVYTQNIDGLEEIAGVSPKRMVYAHGSLQWASCVKCKQKVNASAIERSIKNGQVAHCQVSLKSPKFIPAPSKRAKRSRSTSSNEGSPARARTRSTAHESQCPTKCSGVLKPDVTFFGETLQDKVRRCLEADRNKADALIVIGTSLSVAPMSKVIQYLPPNIPRILINRTVVSPPTTNHDDDESDDEDSQEHEFRQDYTFDAHLLGFCDDVTRALVKEMKGEKSPREVEGQLLAAMDSSGDHDSSSDWQITSIPHDRILLFPGAIAGDTIDNKDGYVEIAHCDGCDEKITGTIRKCIQCFDYDLCQKCYPKLSKSHFNGEHKFAIEKQGARFI